MRTYVIEKITDEAAELFDNWDEVLEDEENNTVIVAEFENYEECEAAWLEGYNNGIYDCEMYCIGIRN